MRPRHPQIPCETMTREGRTPEEQADVIQRFFVRPSFLSLTIGIPFCAYKFLFGLSAIRTGSTLLVPFGTLVIAWATADLVMNAARSAYDLAGRPAPFEYCTIAQVGRLFRRPMVFLAVDTLLSFGAICVMLWSGWIAELTPVETALWNGSTTLNLISLSIVSLYNEMRKA
ncbi:hypothetical protein DSECCO2_268550 [anaerobic digester metagenome]